MKNLTVTRQIANEHGGGEPMDDSIIPNVPTYAIAMCVRFIHTIDLG
jgi:hypothetical protein